MSSTATSAEHGSTKQVNSRGRVMVASLIGTTVEFYDFYVYATAAVLVFPSLFFPAQNETAQLLSSFAVFGVAFIARPLGSVIFGHFGDKFGRKGTLVASLLTMGIATFLIGCLRTASVPGWTFLAPALLVVLRFCQGLALGGEWSGAALLATENAPSNKRAIYGTFPQLGAPLEQAVRVFGSIVDARRGKRDAAFCEHGLAHGEGVQARRRAAVPGVVDNELDNLFGG